ncbi:protein-glutamine gamma-glutamyltransferase [Bacillus dakarensis]|uniref:protein-glutamine gamma-glutamyltransferase n=1 Tax=Robertmurraya dakarensis TaxID=1926278 RepID=UPI0009824586|nr:protein-glutamine gamma-glutamyltransferase [Bacillus dakarensis]
MIIMMGTLLEDPPHSLSEIEGTIFKELQASKYPRYYISMNQLRFEILLRSNIIEAAIKLSNSAAEFNIFKNSKFNPLYWIKTRRGYALRPNVLPSAAIADIFKNGHEYAFECSTAIVLIYYYAVLQSINIQAFNQLFRNLLVWDWSYDEDLKIITKAGTDYIPGNVLYFYNPDYKYPVWIGENTVYMGKDLYFGHGIGIGTKEEMIQSLNTLRKPNAIRSAYLLEQYSTLDFQYLSKFAY